MGVYVELVVGFMWWAVGRLGLRMEDRPESTPRSYSVLDVARNLWSVRVIRRRQNSAEGDYDVYPVYRRGKTRKGEYTIKISHD